MSRNRAMNYEKARRDAKLQAATAPNPVYVRKSERSNQWGKTCIKYAATCEVCLDDIIKGELSYRMKDTHWHHRHLECHD